MKVVGLDLAGKEENDTGFCTLEDSNAETETLHSDKQILREVKEVGPDLIAVDAPFNFPEEGMYRESDLELKKRGYKPLSPNFPGMKILVKRAKGLLAKLENLKLEIEIIEVFPQASKKILQVKPADGANEDEFDSLLCAITGRKYLEGEYEDLKGVVIPVA